MSLISAFTDELCVGFTSKVSHLSLHTADPGTDGANDSGITHAAITWSAPRDGIAYGTASVTVSGSFTHIGLWGGSVFRGAVETDLDYTASTEVNVIVMHRVGPSILDAMVNR